MTKSNSFCFPGDGSGKKQIGKAPLLFLLIFNFTTLRAQRLDIFGGINMSGLNQQIAGQKQDASGTINVDFGMGLFVPFNAKSYRSSEMGNGFFPTLTYIKKATSKSTVVGATKADVKLSYLQFNLPLSFVGGNYGIGIGPYAAYAVAGSKRYRVGNTDKQSIDFANDIKRFDYGVSLDIKLLLFKIQYDLGLANIGTGANGTIKTRSFSLSLEIPIVN